MTLLAIVEAGGAYVPLDPAHPPARLEPVLEDSGPRVLVSEQMLLDRLPAHPARLACLDRDVGDRPGERRAAGAAEGRRKPGPCTLHLRLDRTAKGGWACRTGRW